MQAGFQAAILDVDGVLVDSPHERAWRAALDELMETSWRSIRDRTTYSPDRFTSQLYHAEMSGKPTMSGAQAVLEHFGVPEAEDRTEQYGKRKQQIVDRILAADGVTVGSGGISGRDPRRRRCARRLAALAGLARHAR